MTVVVTGEKQEAGILTEAYSTGQSDTPHRGRFA